MGHRGDVAVATLTEKKIYMEQNKSPKSGKERKNKSSKKKNNDLSPSKPSAASNGQPGIFSSAPKNPKDWKPKHPPEDLDSRKIRHHKKHGKLPESLQRRLAKRASLKGLKPTTSSSLLLRNLPPSVNYALLQNTIPTATRFQLYKKGSKRHAFARFKSKEACEEAAEKLKDLVIEDHQIQISVVSPKEHTDEHQIPADGGASLPLKQCITLANLPFSLTQAELKEEFPTATEVIMNMNKFGRFRGSCLLVFDTVDDCRIAQSACRGRVIGGRPVKFTLGAQFQARKAHETPVCGIKIRAIPAEVDVSQLKALFSEKLVTKVHLNVDSSKTTQTGVLVFKDRASQKAALHRFATEKFFGKRLRARPWTPVSSRVKAKRIPNTDSISAAEIKASDVPTEQNVTSVNEMDITPTKGISQDQETIKGSVKKHKHGKSDLSSSFGSPGSVRKAKNIALNSPDLDTTPEQSTTPAHKSVKKHKRTLDASLNDDSPATLITSDKKAPKAKKARTSLDNSIEKSVLQSGDKTKGSAKKNKTSASP